MLIRNVHIYDKHASIKQLKHVYVTKNTIKNIFNVEDDISFIEKEIQQQIDAKGEYILMPGLLDTHVHGQGGVDFADVGTLPEDSGVPVITRALARTGLSYVMATLVSLELSALKKSLNKIDAYVKKQEERQTPGVTKIVGVHLEGPFISHTCKGAHAGSALQKNINMTIFKDIINAAPSIKEWKITLAPDLPGALDFISQVKDLEKEGVFVKVFLGHCNPDKNIIEKAIAAGAQGFTHLGNACGEKSARGAEVLEKDIKSHLVQWVLENPEKCPPGVELIVDGAHLSQAFVMLLKKRIGDKIILITDALGPSGLHDGCYHLASVKIRKEKNNFYLINDQAPLILAGSAAPLSFCIQKYAEWLAAHEENEETLIRSLYSAIVTNPRITSLSKGAIAKLSDNENFVLINKQGHLKMSACNGVIYNF